MSAINILHISDFHFDPRKKADQSIVVQAFLKDVAGLHAENPIDLVLFTGDLVQGASSSADFQSARETLLDPLMRVVELGNQRLFTCPGNHDVDRDFVRRQAYVEQGLLHTLRTRDAINAFVDQFQSIDPTSGPLPEPFGRQEEFYKQEWLRLKDSGSEVSPFAAVQILQVNGLSIAICAFNTAWRSTGEGGDVDKGKLILSERAVDIAVAKTKHADIRVAMFHHPLDWLQDTDRTSVEALLHSKFDAFFFGHVHSSSPSFTRNPSGGAIYSQAGCLYSKREYFNGYSLVNLNVPQRRVLITAREYSDRLRSFTLATGAIPDGRLELELPFDDGTDGSNLMALLATVRPGIKRLGDDHVRLAGDASSNVDLDKHFICPPLEKTKRVSDEAQEDPSEKSDNRVDLQVLLEGSENTLLLGPSESGKTSLIHYTAYKCASNQLDNPRLPLRGRFFDFKKGDRAIWRAVRAYANEISDGKISAKVIGTIPCLILVDDVDLGSDEQLSLVLDLIDTSENCRWILVAKGSGTSTAISAENQVRMEGFQTISIKELSRAAIRQLSAQWMGVEPGAEANNQTFNQVMEHITRSGLSRNGYIVSLVLWTLKNGLSQELINESVLLENIIEYMLGKMNYQDSLRSEFDFNSKNNILQEISMKFRTSSSSLTKNDVVSFVIEYLGRKGLKYDGARIVEGFIKCGIFIEIDDQVNYRFKRFEEYFSAGYLRDNRSVLEDVLKADGWLGYEREMDMYTSRFRNEADLLEFGRKKLHQIPMPPPKLDGSKLYEYLAKTGSLHHAARRLRKMKKEPMSARKIDDLRDKADATVTRRRSALSAKKKEGVEKISNLTSFIISLRVYTQFIRNLEFADNVAKRDHLNTCFDAWVVHCKMLLSGLSEAFSDISEDIQTDPQLPDEHRADVLRIAQDIESQVKYFVPRMVSSGVYECIGTEKLKDLIEEVANDRTSEVVRRLLASFVLLELDPDRSMELMTSPSWQNDLNDDWICNMVENKLHQYYLEQHISGNLRRKFEDLVSSLETRLAGTKFQSDRIRSSVVQTLQKQTRLREVRESR